MHYYILGTKSLNLSWPRYMYVGFTFFGLAVHVHVHRKPRFWLICINNRFEFEITGNIYITGSGYTLRGRIMFASNVCTIVTACVTSANPLVPQKTHKTYRFVGNFKFKAIIYAYQSKAGLPVSIYHIMHASFKILSRCPAAGRWHKKKTNRIEYIALFDIYWEMSIACRELCGFKFQQIIWPWHSHLRCSEEWTRFFMTFKKVTATCRVHVT